MTGCSRELADMLERRRIDICAVQETKWSGSKPKEIGSGYKMMYHGSPRTRARVGIIVSEKFREAVIEVQRYDDRLMKIMIASDSAKIHFFSAYAPHPLLLSICSAIRALGQETTAVPSKDFVIVAGDLNGHVGTEKNGKCAHGGFGVGERNADGERVLEYADAHELVITNAWFHKRVMHLLT
ncbi:hypothetical protein ANCCEY_12813 [Ancylostoma ceylanicum]|uniref:Endonuclease/exonuclease/phosphatase domain-containing protein n=1 Tax=Ancylostoma ceylanicum TaxID=53326 RepID=A0A0D6LDU4_9BILA|nr:hypothetical protein ANCCEY_12813 [Ancylostoma ceylanicum]